MTWTCPCAAVNAPPARFCEACGLERPGGVPKPERTGSGLAWSPPTPPVTSLPGWHAPRGSHGPLPDDTQRALDVLKAKIGTPTALGGAIDPAHRARFLAACRAKGYADPAALEAAEREGPPPDAPTGDPPPRRRRLSLARLFPVTEQEELRARPRRAQDGT